MANMPHKRKKVASVPLSGKFYAFLVAEAKRRGIDFGSLARHALEKEFGITGDWKYEDDASKEIEPRKRPHGGKAVRAHRQGSKATGRTRGSGHS